MCPCVRRWRNLYSCIGTQVMLNRFHPTCGATGRTGTGTWVRVSVPGDGALVDGGWSLRLHEHQVDLVLERYSQRLVGRHVGQHLLGRHPLFVPIYTSCLSTHPAPTVTPHPVPAPTVTPRSPPHRHSPPHPTPVGTPRPTSPPSHPPHLTPVPPPNPRGRVRWIGREGKDTLGV